MARSTITRLLSLIFATLCACALAACGGDGKYVAQSPEKVRTTLREVSPPLQMFSGSVVGNRIVTPDDQTVIIALVGSSDNEMMRFVVSIVPDGDGSRVSVDLRPGEGANKQRGIELFNEQPGYARHLQDLGAEMVFSALENRPFDATFGATAEGKMMLATNPDLRDEIDAANRSNADSDREQATARRARAGMPVETVWDQDARERERRGEQPED